MSSDYDSPWKEALDHPQKLTFSQLVAVVFDALTRYRSSGRKAIRDALDRHKLSTQQRAV